MLTLASRQFIDTTGPVRLVGRWTWLTGIFGFGYMLINLVIIFLGIPYGYKVVTTPCKDACNIYGQLSTTNIQDLAKIGISVETYAISYVIILLVFTVIAMGVAGLILWKKPGELLPLSAALVIMSLPGIEGQFVFFSDLFQVYPILGILNNIFNFPSLAALAYLFLTFSNGKFRSKIFLWLFIAVGLAPSLTFFYLEAFGIQYAVDPINLSLPIALPLTLAVILVSFIRGKNYSLRNIARYGGLTLICVAAILVSVNFTQFLVFLVAMIYRSLKILSPRERNSAKWLIYGFTIFVTMLFTFYGVLPQFPDLLAPGTYWFLLFNVVGFFGCMVNLTGILMAVLYANAFDINLVIKRTVVYTTLSVLVVAIYFGSVVVLQELLQTVTGQGSSLAVVGATLVAALLFQPLRLAIQGFVDQRFYRRKYDAARTIAALRTSLQNETDLGNLTHQVKAVIDETMQPEMVLIWVKSHHRSNRLTGLK